MASTYVNDLRLNEMATGDGSGTWGETTNTNLELIAEAFSYGTEAITTNADTHATVIADGATDPGRSMYLKYTGTLDSACTITISPNTVSKLWFIENATTGSQNIILSCGSGANITILPGDTKVVYSDGAGSGAAFIDAFASLSVVDLKVQDDLTVTDAALVTGVLTTTATQVATGGITSGSDIISDTDSTDSLGSTGVRWLKGWFDTLTAGTLTVGSGSVTDSSGAISFGDENLTTTGIVTAAGTSVFTNLDISGDVDVDGTLETDNLTVGGAQGTDGQVLTSTGSGVAWEDASGGGGVTFKEQGTNFTNSVMVGDDATGTLSSATGNTALGIDVFAALTSGIDNVAVGYAAMTALTSAYSNVAVGANALDSLTSGHSCTGVGHNSLAGVTTANHNVGVGLNTGLALTTGNGNTAIGSNTMNSGTTALENTVVGTHSATSMTDGQGNTLIGTVSGIALTTGDYNSTLGYASGYAITTGEQNICIGASAGLNLTTGSGNIAIGMNSLNGATTVSNQTAVGYHALKFLTTGEANTAVGYIALNLNTTGSGNAAIGQNALGSNTTADGNTGLGYSAGYGVTTGGGNTFVGASSGTSPVISTGTDNTFVGSAASGTATDTVNANALGRGVKSESGYTTVGIDGSDIRAANGTATWATVSDRRVKKDIEDSTVGLNFINDLRPRTFNYKNKGDIPEEFRGYEEGSTESYKYSTTNHGFIAQEVKAVIDNHTDIADGFKLWDVRETGQQEVAEAALIPMLVKAIQELSAEVEKLKGE
jgi:trimeric autotransporter adhesin